MGKFNKIVHLLCKFNDIGHLLYFVFYKVTSRRVVSLMCHFPGGITQLTARNIGMLKCKSQKQKVGHHETPLSSWVLIIKYSNRSLTGIMYSCIFCVIRLQQYQK